MKYCKCLVMLFFPAITYSQVKTAKSSIDSAVSNLVSKHQVLLTNHAIFTAHKDAMEGASAFLVNYRNKVFAVTAKHVLGEAMGVQPEVNLQDLNRDLISWKMFPRVVVGAKYDTVSIGKTTLDYSLMDKDILLLETVNTGYKIFPLTPNFNLPVKGDRCYIIGCPYSQANCKQNVYEIFYERYEEETSMLNFIIKAKFELAGFSGAPIVDQNGKVISVLTSGWEEGKVKFVGGTYIKEIQKVK